MRALGRLADSSALHVEVIAGGANPHYDQLTELAESLGGRFHLVRNAADMPQRIAEADLAITAGGSTCWEMAYLGLPNVVIVLADNQRACAAGLDAQGCSVSLGWHEDCDEARIAEAFANLADDPKRRADMSRAGMELVDGEGASRTVTHMDAGNRDRLRLRPVREDDCRQVWEWSNDKAMRENSFHSKLISWEEHCRWFAHHVHSEDSWLYICENCHGTPVGMVRFHRLEQEPEACDLSIVVDPLRRGEGIGSEILLMGQQALLASSDIRRVYAWVLDQNTTSQRLFENVGYRLQQTAERMEKQARLYVFENGLTRRQT
jgi:RimJ/RimL family protein N-acetyltransferase